MRARKSLLIPVICLCLAFIATRSPAQEAQVDLLATLGAGAKLAVISVSGPSAALHNETISVTYRIKNLGTAASGSYRVSLYLSKDNKIDPAADRLLDKVTFATGLAPGETKRATAKVLVPSSGLSGNYYYGATVAGSKKASAGQVALTQYSLADNLETVTDHKTGLVWEQADDGQVRNWDSANQYCDDLVLGGYKDWRLPGMDELQTLIDFSRHHPAMDPVFFCRSGNYWSSSSVAGYSEAAWFVNFTYAYADWLTKSHSHYSRCVRGGPW